MRSWPCFFFFGQTFLLHISKLSLSADNPEIELSRTKHGAENVTVIHSECTTCNSEWLLSCWTAKIKYKHGVRALVNSFVSYMLTFLRNSVYEFKERFKGNLLCIITMWVAYAYEQCLNSLHVACTQQLPPLTA